MDLLALDRALSSRHDAWPRNLIRHCTLEDVDFLIDVGRACYPPFDEDAIRKWLESLFTNPSAMMLRSENGACIASITRLIYRDRPMCYFVFLCARPNKTLEGYRLLKSMVECARERGASQVHIGSETGFDFAPFAKRLGWEVENPTYVLRM